MVDVVMADRGMAYIIVIDHAVDWLGVVPAHGDIRARLSVSCWFVPVIKRHIYGLITDTA